MRDVMAVLTAEVGLPEALGRALVATPQSMSSVAVSSDSEFAAGASQGVSGGSEKPPEVDGRPPGDRSSRKGSGGDQDEGEEAAWSSALIAFKQVGLLKSKERCTEIVSTHSHHTITYPVVRHIACGRVPAVREGHSRRGHRNVQSALGSNGGTDDGPSC